MYEAGRLLKFTPFTFKNGAQPKPKFFVVLCAMGNDIMMASLPTSKDHIPQTLYVDNGCVNDKERGVSAYVFREGEKVTECFSFHRKTFIYAEQVDEYSCEYLKAMSSEVANLGIIKNDIFEALKECLISSKMLKRKYRKYLS